MTDAIIYGNYRIAELNSNRLKARQKILPGTVGVVAQIIRDEMYCTYLGDCSVWRFRNNKVERITNSQTQKIKQQSNSLASFTVREDLYNNPKNPF